MTELKNLKPLSLCLTVISVLTILANAPLVQAQSSAQLSVLQSDANRIVLELSVSGYDSHEVTIGGRTFTTFSIGDLGQTGESGSPQLPVKGAMIGIPPGAQASFQIIADDSRTVLQSRPPLPVPTQQIEHDPRTGLPIYRADSYEPNPATFSANQFYPAQPAKIGGVGNWRSQHYATVQFFPLQYNPVSHQLVFHRRVRVEIALSYPRGQSPAMIGSFLNEAAFESVFQNAFANYSSAKNWRARPALVPSRRAPSTSSACPNATGPCYKIGVNTDGIYKVACNQLPSVTQPITASAVQMFKQGTEIAINVSGGWGSSCTNNDYVEFFGLAATGKYTSTNIYWLTYGNPVTGKRMTTRAGTPGVSTLATSFTKTVHLEQNFIYRPIAPQIEGYEHWYWQYLAPYTGVSSQDYSFQINHFASSNLSPTLLSNLVGADAGNHHTRIWLNSCNTMDDGVWSGSVERFTTLIFPDSCLNPITNTLHITESNEANFYDVMFTNYFDVSYQSTFDATNDSIRFQQPVSNTWRYSINGFTNANIETFDIADPFNVTSIVNFNVTGTGPYQLQFEDAVTTTARTYLALTTAQRITPTSVIKDMPSNLQNSVNGADDIIIAASPFVTNAQLQQLKNLRATQFARVQLIDAQDIYDEFNDGVMDPQAIHDFLQYSFTNWTPPAPQFVLLVGAGNADPQSYCLATANPCNPNQYQTAPNSTLIPPYLRMVEPYAYGETASDNCLVVFSGTCNLTTHSLPEMFLGRLPADTTADLTALVNKIVNYENPPPGQWRSTVSFVTDAGRNADGSTNRGGNFWLYSDGIACDPKYFPRSLIADRIYYNPYDQSPGYASQCPAPFPTFNDQPTTTNAITFVINSGRLMVNYIGHGALQYWADGILFGSYPRNDLAGLTNGSKTPIMLELTCNTGYFIYPHPLAQSFAKLNVNLSGNGAVASWAAVGLGFVSGHDLLEKGFFNAVMNQNTRQLGPATTAGKANLFASGTNLDLIDTTILFGDPASRIPLQMRTFLPLVNK